MQLQSSTELVGAESGGDFNFLMVSVDQIDLPEKLSDLSSLENGNSTENLLLPIIVFNDGNRYVVIDGCKRFVCMVQSGRKVCACGVIRSVQDSKSAGLLRIYLNRGRVLSFKEKFLFLRWLKENLSEKEYSIRIAELGIQDRERHNLEQLMFCSNEVLEAVERGYVDPANAPDMIHFSESDCGAVLQYLSRFSFSRQMQRELLEWLPELAFRNKCSIKQILEHEDLRNIMENGKLNDPQRVRKIRDILFALRFPHLVVAKKRWDKIVREVNPDHSRVHFQSSEAFEKNNLEIRISISSPEQASTILHQLCSISSEKWEQLIYPALNC